MILINYYYMLSVFVVLISNTILLSSSPFFKKKTRGYFDRLPPSVCPSVHPLWYPILSFNLTCKVNLKKIKPNFYMFPVFVSLIKYYYTCMLSAFTILIKLKTLYFSVFMIIIKWDKKNTLFFCILDFNKMLLYAFCIWFCIPCFMTSIFNWRWYKW